jgi:Domain of unknown function (DUF4466)
MKRKFIYTVSPIFVAALLLFIGCKKEEYALPVAKDVLQNTALKRTLGPNIVTQTIDLAYSAAILPSKGKLTSIQVEASIAGATGTFLENRSFFTNGSGVDVGVTVGSPSVNEGTKSTVNFTLDTSAATLRYSYVIPEEARGKTVSFTFTAKSSNGETVSTTMGPYTVAKMDMVRLLSVKTDSAYISIADLKVYDPKTAATNASKIDLVYLFRNITTSAFSHALVSPAADTAYLPNVKLPAGLTNSTKMQKVFNLQDFNLARLQFGIYIDDKDFQDIDLTNAPNYAINLRAEAGVWVQTADNKYKAYVFINSVTAAGTAVISIKRYAL